MNQDNSDDYARGFMTPILGGIAGLILGSIVGDGLGAVVGGLIGCISAFLILSCLVKDTSEVNDGDCKRDQ